MPNAPPASAIRDRFVADHRGLEEMGTRLLVAVEAGAGPAVQALWSAFADRLSEHLEAEERHLFPKIHRSNPRSARALVEEHRHIRSRIDEVRVDVEQGAVRVEAVRGFTAELCAHERHEEDVMDRWHDENLSAGEAETVFEVLGPQARRA
jgi:iron-sulfur cluster repair protein YtfE (RIC family)